MTKVFRKSWITVVFLMQILPNMPVAYSKFEKFKEGDILQLNQPNRIPRRNGDNFNRFFKNNRSFGSNYHLPKGSIVRYTGQYTERPGGGFGVQVELMSGIEDEHIGKLVWIYYSNNEQTIHLTDEKVSPDKIRNAADFTEEDDLIDSHESPSDFFGESNKPSQIEISDIPKAIQDAQEIVDKSGNLSTNIQCTEATCNPDDIDSQLMDELNKSISSSNAVHNLLQAGIPKMPLVRALHFYNENKEKRNLKDKYLVVADLTQPSNKKRMYKIDLKTGKVQKYTTSHGSGYSNQLNCANTFGNRHNSHLSSGGGYVTGSTKPYKGRSALSLHGVESGKNDNVFSRGVLLHRASYVGDNYAGRTYGCLSIQPKYADEFIRSIQGSSLNTTSYTKNGTAIYIYPDRDDLLNRSSYWDESCKSVLKSKNRHPTWIK